MPGRGLQSFEIFKGAVDQQLARHNGARYFLYRVVNVEHHGMRQLPDLIKSQLGNSFGSPDAQSSSTGKKKKGRNQGHQPAATNHKLTEVVECRTPGGFDRES